MHRVLLAIVATIALVLISFAPSTASARLPDDGFRPQRAMSFSGPDALGAAAGADLKIPPPERNTNVKLASGALREAVARLQVGQPAGNGVRMVDERVRVEILHHLSEAGIDAVVTSAGGTIDGRVPGVLVEGFVPWQALEALEAKPGVDYIRPPLSASIPIYDPPGSAGVPQVNFASVTGQEVTKTNGDEWHAAGYTGTGVKVGVIDSFNLGAWNAAASAGELPAPAGTFCRQGGVGCDIWTARSLPGALHGEGVAEIIYEMAPDAQLYLATGYTASDLQSIVDYFDSQGVQIISRSETAEYDGPGDGTGPIATVINNAVANGMIWLNAAGNAAGSINDDGGYWRSPWVDGDADQWLNFSGDIELMPFWCGFVNGLRWNDWGSNKTDYDLFVFDDAFGLFLKTSSLNNQGGGASPIESVALTLNCGQDDVDFVGIQRYAPGGGSSGDVLEFMTNSAGLAYWSNPYSASGPMSDTASPGALSIGAIDPPTGTGIANYSSWGPTNDSRTKPDLSAAACVSSYTYSPQCFNGTSSATPAVAGAAALVLDAGLASTPSQLKTWLLNNATVDRGSAGIDSVYGKGELILPAPPAGPTATATPSPTPTHSPAATTPPQTATPTPTYTPTPTPTHTPTPTGTPGTPPTTFTPTPTPTPTPTTPPGQGGLAGDVDCSGGVNSVDSLKILRFVASLSVAQNEPCADIGGGIVSLAPQSVVLHQGDVDCNGSPNSVDALKILRFVAGMPNNLPAGCPAIGTPTGGPTPTPTGLAVTQTPTHTPSASPSRTPTGTPTKSLTPTPTVTQSKTPTPTASKTPTPTPTQTSTLTPTPTPVGQAYNFRWYVAVPLAPQDPSECNFGKPIPPNSPAPDGLCVAFDLVIPDATYDVRTVLRFDGLVVIDQTAPVHLYTGTDWQLTFLPPIPNGTYEYEFWVNGVMLGSTSVVVAPATTPTPTPTPSPSPSPTPSPTPQPTPAPVCSNVNPPAPIPDNNPAGVSLQIPSGVVGIVADLDICVNISHLWPGDLFVKLTHEDTGTSVVLIDRPGVPVSTYGCDQPNVSVLLDDDGSTSVENACPVSGTLRPQQALSAFDGESLSGTWTLTASDLEADIAGSITGFVIWYLAQ